MRKKRDLRNYDKYDDRLISGNTFANQANIETFCVGFKVKFFKKRKTTKFVNYKGSRLSVEDLWLS